MLTLGIGAALAIFSFVDAALIQPSPYRDPSRLVSIFGSVPLGPRFHPSFPDYYDRKKQNKVFSSFEVYDSDGFMLTTPTGTQLAPGARVSAGFFRTLGVAPILGRDFSDGEDRPSAPQLWALDGNVTRRSVKPSEEFCACPLYASDDGDFGS